jgi:nucleoside-diphosphate-sugar epimerase
MGKVESLVEVAMRILVTGAGIIGSHTARILRERGHDVRLVDIAPNLTAVGSLLDLKEIPLLKADVTDANASWLAAAIEPHPKGSYIPLP